MFGEVGQFQQRRGEHARLGGREVIDTGRDYQYLAGGDVDRARTIRGQRVSSDEGQGAEACPGPPLCGLVWRAASPSRT